MELANRLVLAGAGEWSGRRVLRLKVPVRMAASWPTGHKIIGAPALAVRRATDTDRERASRTDLHAAFAPWPASGWRGRA